MKFSNNYIVDDVARNYNITGLIKQMIDYSYFDKSYDDLFQYIMEQLLKMNNDKLNQLYKDKKLRPFISQMILRQRNGGFENNTEYAKYFHIKDSNENKFNLPYDEDEYNYLVEDIVKYINEKIKFDETKKYTLEELHEILGFKLFKIMYYNDIAGWKIGKEIGMNVSNMYSLINKAKKKLKLVFEND